jgi:2-(1,2-epoxy-1,2-dihydrophenyl)acetyl-CoA isomerase
VIADESRDGMHLVRLAQRTLVPALLSDLVEQLHQAAASGRPVIVTGSDGHFCLGADMHWLASYSNPALAVAELVAVHHLAITTIVEMPVPVIAAVNGTVAGGGLGLALAADYCIAGASAGFTAAYFKLGLTPDGGASAFLERSIGPVRTRELLLTNRRLGAEEALDWGMINAVVPDDQLIEAALAFATSLGPIPSETLLQTRRLLDASFLRNQLQLEATAIRRAAKSTFFREAIEAFRQSHAD